MQHQFRYTSEQTQSCESAVAQSSRRGLRVGGRAVPGGGQEEGVAVLAGCGAGGCQAAASAWLQASK